MGRHTLIQSDGVFKLGADTLDLGRFVTLRKGWRVCDLCCGSGALGLLLLEREGGLRLTGVELDPAAAELAERNYGGNSVEGSVLCGDLRAPALLPAGAFDLVVSNPPWFPEGAGKSGGPARSEEGCTLIEICAAAGRLVKNGGRFALVHRPERLADLFTALREAGLEPKRLQLVQHRLDTPPSVVLLESVKQGGAGLTVLPVLLRST